MQLTGWHNDNEMRNAWTPKFQLSDPTVHSYTVTTSCIIQKEKILFDCSRKEWAAQYEVRNLKALSAAPYVLFPTHYIGDEGYFSDTETSTFAPRTNKSQAGDDSGAPAPKVEL